MGDIVYAAAFPKSGVTYLNFMLYYALFDPPYEPAALERDCIIDVHAFPANVPAPGSGWCYVKTHSPFGASLALRDRADRAICLVRHPIDIMMSLWDFVHLTGSEALWNLTETDRKRLFDEFVEHWVTSGGDPSRFGQIDFVGNWIGHVTSWLDQGDIPTLFVRYEALKAEPVAQLSRIVAFIGKPVGRERLEIAARKSMAPVMRQDEEREIDSGSTEASTLYQPGLKKAYERGFRFIGKLHSNSYRAVLTEPQRRSVDQLFGSILARVDARIA